MPAVISVFRWFLAVSLLPVITRVHSTLSLTDTEKPGDQSDLRPLSRPITVNKINFFRKSKVDEIHCKSFYHGNFLKIQWTKSITPDKNKKKKTFFCDNFVNHTICCNSKVVITHAFFYF